MSVETIDRMLAEWEERLRRIDESLLALEAETTYQMLAPTSAARPRLEGETARVVVPALAALGELFEHRGRLTDALDRARAVRGSMSGIAFWGNDDKEREIHDLLQGPSIELPAEATPLARRALLDPGSRDVRVVPEQLLAAMGAAFERARDAVVAVQEAWDRIEPAMAAIERQVHDARASAVSLGVEEGVRDELAAIERELETARARLARDPLGASGDVGARLVPRVAAVAAQLDGLAAQRTRVDEVLSQARALLKEVAATHSAARAATLAMPKEVDGASVSGTPSDAAFVGGLAPWLDKIVHAASGGRWSSAEVGLTRWNEAARGCLANDARIAGALSSVLARRDELTGRLSARRAQAASLAARGLSLDPAVEEVAREAERLLAHRPTPLARASELVDRYEVALRAAARASK